MSTRRTFLQQTAALAAVGMTAKSYAAIPGANDRLNFAVIGLNGRAGAHLSALRNNRADARISHVCDVDSRILAKFTAATTRDMGEAPIPVRDFRELLAVKDIDAITIATPEHWHTPMAILGLKAGKHVYVEKPCSHNPAEGVMLVQAQKKYGKLVQMGNQQRSSAHTIEVVDRIHNGLIGRAYFGSAWYANTRASIGVGQNIPVPAELDWELWQGPAPRRPYRSNVHPYNWHWFKHYGTGETLNNGTHEVDVARWALQAEMPTRITAAGGRYQYKDDWEFYDTLVTSFEYPDQTISWEGRCCNSMKIYGRERGCTILGTKGSVLIDRDGYEVYDAAGKKVDEFKVGSQTSSADTIGRDSMTDLHFGNFIDGIRNGTPLNSPIPVANVSVTMLQLSNVAYFVNRELKVDPQTGHVLNDPEAMKYWFRDYEKGWEVRV